MQIQIQKWKSVRTTAADLHVLDLRNRCKYLPLEYLPQFSRIIQACLYFCLLLCGVYSYRITLNWSVLWTLWRRGNCYRQCACCSLVVHMQGREISISSVYSWFQVCRPCFGRIWPRLYQGTLYSFQMLKVENMLSSVSRVEEWAKKGDCIDAKAATTFNCSESTQIILLLWTYCGVVRSSFGFCFSSTPKILL